MIKTVWNKKLMNESYSFTEAEKRAVYKAIAQRRDMRHFNGRALNAAILQRILSAAHRAPSVGLMQPWRFIRITDYDIRRDLYAIVEKERGLTAEALGEQKAAFLKLKVEGVMQCSELLVAALPDKRDQHIFGRRTMPEMDLASLSCAIQNMWLAARVEGVGMGWVSLFDPEDIKVLLRMPKHSHPVAILCIGPVDAFYEKPMLVSEGWAQEKPLAQMLFENKWVYGHKSSDK
ncbi:5,6-dimethylbenzimidazole synthase [Marinagarivorans algicola]|uniref:5,6-dimethylbenzimidazole synthase n=1 Tax=Marinagarivorans algicola TaxID=1513270 RepID=UPI00373630A3